MEYGTITHCCSIHCMNKKAVKIKAYSLLSSQIVAPVYVPQINYFNLSPKDIVMSKLNSCSL